MISSHLYATWLIVRRLINRPIKSVYSWRAK